jgi:hypothetical protein
MTLLTGTVVLPDMLTAVTVLPVRSAAYVGAMALTTMFRAKMAATNTCPKRLFAFMHYLLIKFIVRAEIFPPPG